MVQVFSEDILNRMVRAVERVRDRLKRATTALTQGKVRYAVAGGNAVAAWVAKYDERAVRNTQDVDIMLVRDDLPAAIEAMSAAGFIFRHVKSIDMFLDGPDSRAIDAVHILFAGEKIRADYLEAAPSLDRVAEQQGYKVLELEDLVRMKLTSFRDKDRMHLRDLLDVGAIDSAWAPRFIPPLAERLQQLIDTPDG